MDLGFFAACRESPAPGLLALFVSGFGFAATFFAVAVGFTAGAATGGAAGTGTCATASGGAHAFTGGGAINGFRSPPISAAILRTLRGAVFSEIFARSSSNRSSAALIRSCAP